MKEDNNHARAFIERFINNFDSTVFRTYKALKFKGPINWTDSAESEAILRGSTALLPPQFKSFLSRYDCTTVRSFVGNVKHTPTLMLLRLEDREGGVK